MSTTQNTIETTSKSLKFTSDIYRVCNTKKSQWLMEGTGEGTGNPENRMHSSNLMMLEVTSRLFLGPEKGYIRTQYVIGASTHYVDDYYVNKDTNEPVFDKMTKEQAAKRGLEFQVGLLSIYGKDGLREEEARSKRKGICFERGELNLKKYGSDPVLKRFVEEHEQNKMAPNAAINNDPTRLRIFMFEPLIKESKAAKTPIVESFDDNLEAMNFVGKMRTKTAKGYEYNESMMDAVLAILEDGVGLEPGEQIQKFAKIARAASAGAAFIKLIRGVMNEYRMEIGKANELNVLEISATETKIVVDGKKKAIQTFKAGTSKEDITDELIIHFLGSPMGISEFKDLKRQVEIAKIASLNKKP